jgi:hypothetical protein
MPVAFSDDNRATWCQRDKGQNSKRFTDYYAIFGEVNKMIPDA